MPKHRKMIKVLQNIMLLFGQLYIAMQGHKNDLDEFFAWDTDLPSFPLGLWQASPARHIKSGLLQCLVQSGQSESPSGYNCKILAGAVIVHCQPNIKVSTFENYADKGFHPWPAEAAAGYQEVGCCMGHIHPRQFEGVHPWEERTRGSKESIRPIKAGNWMDFPHDPMNKKELFAFLTSKIEEFNWPTAKSLYITSGQDVSSFSSSSIMNCCNC